jgi:hypothetical protein
MAHCNRLSTGKNEKMTRIASGEPDLGKMAVESATWRPRSPRGRLMRQEPWASAQRLIWRLRPGGRKNDLPNVNEPAA